MKKKDWNVEAQKIKNKLLELAENGIMVNSKNFREIMGVGYWIINQCGIKSLARFYEEHGYKYIHALCYPKEDVVNDVLRVYNEHGYIKQEMYLEHGKYSKVVIKRLFGSFNKMLKELNIPLNMYKYIDEIPDQDIIGKMWELYDKYGELTAVTQRKESGYSETIINRKFGSFNNMLRIMGLPLNDGSYSDDEVLYAMKLIYYEFGTLNTELIDKYGLVSFPTCLHRFGCIKDILKLLHIDDVVSYKDSFGAKCIENTLLFSYDYCFEKEKTWDWLVNPKTSHHLFVDFYIPELKLCIEFNGLQHYQYTPHFHESIEHYQICAERDKVKERLVLNHDMRFEVIKYDDDIENKLNKILTS
jgi:hypothetical protein